MAMARTSRDSTGSRGSQSSRAAAFVFAPLFACACAGGSSSVSPAVPAATPAASPARQENLLPEPKGSIARTSIARAIKAGLGRFLGYLDVDASLTAQHKFEGWRIIELRGPMGTWD